MIYACAQKRVLMVRFVSARPPSIISTILKLQEAFRIAKSAVLTAPFEAPDRGISGGTSSSRPAASAGHLGMLCTLE